MPTVKVYVGNVVDIEVESRTEVHIEVEMLIVLLEVEVNAGNELDIEVELAAIEVDEHIVEVGFEVESGNEVEEDGVDMWTGEVEIGVEVNELPGRTFVELKVKEGFHETFNEIIKRLFPILR